MECGLGGRLDGTNICNSKVAAITSIGLDHCDVLGYTLDEICGEKAGIIRPGVKDVVIGPGVNSQIVAGKCAETGTSLHSIDDSKNYRLNNTKIAQ